MCYSLEGLHWPDADDVIAGVERMTQPIVLVPDQMPDDRSLSHRVSVIPLSHVSQLSHDGLEIDHQHLFAMVADQQERLVESDSQPVSGKKQKLLVRRQVKAEIQSMLTDDVLVAAYSEYGSYRKAADALSEQTGQLISKDKVSRAVQRRGGPRSVRSETNSNSVRRTVASQRCDRRKKIQNHPEAMDWE